MSSDPQLDAGGIVQRQFTTARRGYDADEVRAYLQQLATLVGDLQRGEAGLRERAEKAEARARQAEQLDEHRLVEILGEETARVLDAARAASTDIRGKAEESASRLISEANHEAHRVRAESEAALAAQRTELLAEIEKLRAEAAGELDRRRAEGNEVVAQMRREAQAECDSLRQQGEQKRLEAEMQAETIRAKAREEGRALIAEAQVVRERVLGDLARRRRTAREQLERLNAARERLLAAYEVVRRTVDEATGELKVVLPEAKVAGDSAVRRVKGEPEPSVEQLEDMVAMARITGLLEDAASQGFDEDDYLAEDAPPPDVRGVPVPAAVGPADDGAEPLELYDVEAEDDLVVDDDLVAEDDLVVDDDLVAEDDLVVGEVDVDADRGDGAAPAEPEPEVVELDDDYGMGGDDDEGRGDTVLVEPAATGAEPADPMPVQVPVNGHGRPVVAGVAPSAVPGSGPDTVDAGAPFEPAVAAAAVALASGPSAVEAETVDGLDVLDGAEVGLVPSAGIEIVDDRRINGHPHPSVEVDGDDEDEDEAGYGDEDDDLGEDEWFDEADGIDDGSATGIVEGMDDDVDDPGASSSVDELFARLKAGRDAPAPEPALDDEHDRHDGHDEAEVDADLDVAAATVLDDDLAPAGGPGERRRASSLAAMSDADILASAGYGDAGDDGYGGYGSADGDDLTAVGEGDGGDDSDMYGLPITRAVQPGEPDPAMLVDGVGEDDGVGADDADAGFADMDPDEAMLRLRDDSLETVEHDLSRRLKRVLADEQNEILDTLRRHKAGTLDDLLPGGSEAHVARYAEAALEGLSTAAAWGAASVEGEPGRSYETLAGELGRTVVEPLRERIARSFNEAAGDVDDATGRLRALYREWKGHHLAAAAQHYAVAAYARGAFEAVPDGAPVRWLVDRGTDPCPDADDNALAGSVCKGEAFPTGDRCPPAHPGCRCMVVPLDWPQLG